MNSCYSRRVVAALASPVRTAAAAAAAAYLGRVAGKGFAGGCLYHLLVVLYIRVIDRLVFRDTLLCCCCYCSSRR